MEEAVFCRGYLQPLAIVRTTKISTPSATRFAAPVETKLASPAPSRKSASRISKTKEKKKSVDAVVGQEVEFRLISDAIEIGVAAEEKEEDGDDAVTATAAAGSSMLMDEDAAPERVTPSKIKDATLAQCAIKDTTLAPNGKIIPVQLASETAKKKRFVSSLPMTPITICAQCVTLVGDGAHCEHHNLKNGEQGGELVDKGGEK